MRAFVSLSYNTNAYMKLCKYVCKWVSIETGPNAAKQSRMQMQILFSSIRSHKKSKYKASAH